MDSSGGLSVDGRLAVGGLPVDCRGLSWTVGSLTVDCGELLVARRRTAHNSSDLLECHWQTSQPSAVSRYPTEAGMRSNEIRKTTRRAEGARQAQACRAKRDRAKLGTPREAWRCRAKRDRAKLGIPSFARAAKESYAASKRKAKEHPQSQARIDLFRVCRHRLP